MTPQPAQIGAHLSVSGGLYRAVDRALDLHMTAVQIFTKSNRRWQDKPLTETSITAWQERFAESGLAAAVSHASYLINLAAPDQPVQTKSRLGLQDELQRACLLGIPQVVMHPGAHKGTGPDAGIEHIAEAVRATYSKHPELADTRLLFEVMAGQGTVLGRNPAELGKLLNLLDGEFPVGVCLDTCHAFAAGFDLRTPGGYADYMALCDQEFGLTAVGCWHLNDSKGTLGSHLDRHQHLGEGELGTAPFACILNDSRWFKTPLLLETPKTIERTSDLRNMQVLGALLTDSQRVPAGLMSEELHSETE